MPFLLYFIPLEAILGILLWIGLIITAQAFQEVPKAHAPAVAIGFIPSLASWVHAARPDDPAKSRARIFTLQEAAEKFSPDIFVNGMLCLAQGFMFIAIFFSAIMAKVIDRQWRAAANLVPDCLGGVGMRDHPRLCLHPGWRLWASLFSMDRFQRRYSLRLRFRDRLCAAGRAALRHGCPKAGRD